MKRAVEQPSAAKKVFTHAYAGYCPDCNNPSAVTVDTGDRSAAKFVAAIIRSGRRVERITIQAVRDGGFCLCSRKPKQPAPSPLVSDEP